MLQSFISFHLKTNSSSNKIPKHIEDLLQKASGSINNLHTEEAWDKATGYFVQHILIGINQFRMHYLLHLKNICNTSVEERKRKIIHLLAKQFEKSHPHNIIGGNNYTKVIFGMIEENGLFSQHYHMFSPLRFDNDFNTKLIRLLIGNNHFDIAEKYCNEQISANYKQEYDIVYLKLLKEIYTIKKDQKNLAKVLTELFPYTFDFDDYISIANQLPEDERKKWRTKILSRASNASHGYNIAANVFCFKLMDHEKNYKKMIDYVDSYANYTIISHKTKLMNALIRKSDDHVWRHKEESGKNDETCFPELFALAEKYYTANYLKMVIANAEKDKWYFRSNHFLTYVKEKLVNIN